MSIYIQQIWNNIKSPVPKWLDQVTLILLGQAYKDELSQKRDQKILTQKELEEKNNQTRQSNKDAIRELLRQQNLSRLSRNKQRRQSQLEQPKNILSHEELEEKVNQERQSNEDLIRELLKQQNSSRLSRSKQRRQSQLEQEKSINEEQVESQNSLRMSRRARRQAHPKNVYIGLPDNLQHLVLWVSREYRTNRLSHIPGGSDVVVEYHDERVLGYDWIKRPSAYIREFFAGIVEYSSSAFKKLDEQSQIEVTKRKISRVFTRKYNDENERSKASFIEIWNSETSNEMPWTSLARLESKENILSRQTANKYYDEDLLDQFFSDENWLHQTFFSKKLDQALEWNRNHPPQQSNLDLLETQLQNNE